MKAFTLPSTPMCRVVYTRQGTNYGATMQTPADVEDLRMAMLAKSPPVASKDIVRIEPVTPLSPMNHGHPAAHRMVKYAALTACLLVLGLTISQTVELPASVIEWQNVC